MIVTLNGKPFDVTLEKERTVGELLSGIESWLERSRCSVSALDLNGRTISVEQVENICATELDDVDTLDIRASSWNDLLAEALIESDRLLSEAVRAGSSDDLAARYETGPASGFLEVNAKDMHRRIAEALKGTSAEDIEALKAEIADRVREIDEPIAELSRTRERIEAIAARLEEVPLELQTGKDVQAAKTLGDFAALTGTLFRLMPLVETAGVDLSSRTVEGHPFPDFLDDLKTALKELTAGYENGDAILVGDLAEYELAPRLRTLAEALAETAPNNA